MKIHYSWLIITWYLHCIPQGAPSSGANMVPLDGLIIIWPVGGSWEPPGEQADPASLQPQQSMCSYHHPPGPDTSSPLPSSYTRRPVAITPPPSDNNYKQEAKNAPKSGVRRVRRGAGRPGWIQGGIQFWRIWSVWNGFYKSTNIQPEYGINSRTNIQLNLFRK